MRPSIEQFWNLVKEIEEGQKQGRLPLLSAIEQIYPAENAVEMALAKEVGSPPRDFEATIEVANDTYRGKSSEKAQSEAEDIWISARQLLRTRLDTDIYNLWFLPIKAVAVQDEALVLEVPDDFCEVWLRDNYLGLISTILVQASGRNLRVKFLVNANGSTAGDLAIEHKAEAKPITEPVKQGGAVRAEFTFNPKNTFESFVVGENNSHAVSAAKAISEAPGKSYNPLFLYGGVGLGKTHLLHAIGQRVGETRKGARITFLSSEKFASEYTDAIQNNRVVRFRRKFRQTDILLIDDVQFLSGKERIQEEFFHTFNALHDAHKQIVLTCDRPAANIQNLEQRLVSRFELGLTTEIRPPDVDTRWAILQMKKKAIGAELPEEIVDFLANRIHSSVRRLEGAFTRLASFVALDPNRRMTVQLASSMLREILDDEDRGSVDVISIQKKAAFHHDVRLAALGLGRKEPASVSNLAETAPSISKVCEERYPEPAASERNEGSRVTSTQNTGDQRRADSHVCSALPMRKSPATLMVAVLDREIRIKINGRADFNSGLDLKKLIAEIALREYNHFVFDLSECLTMDSTFLGVLSGIGLEFSNGKRTPVGQLLELINPNPRITETLKDLGVAALFTINNCSELLTGGFEVIATCSKSTRAELIRNCLEAHQTLMSITPENIHRYKETAEILAKDLEEIQELEKRN